MGFLRRNILIDLTAIDASMAAVLNVTFKNLRRESSDGEVLAQKSSTVQTVDSIASISLPCKTTGSIQFECRITTADASGTLLNNPADKFYLDYGDGSDVDLSELLVGGTAATNTVTDYIDEQIAAIPGGGGGGASTLDELTDVTLTTLANDDILQRKAGVFVNRSLSQLKTDLSLSGVNSGDQDLSGYQTTANKSTDVNADQASATKYPTVKAVYDWAISLFVQKNISITGATKTKITYDAKGLVTSGADATQDDIGDGTTNKQYSATDKTKLSGIANSATANSSDATLLNRANHTGTQLSSTISDFNSAALTAAPAETATTIGTIVAGLAAKNPPVNADYFSIYDSVASALKVLTFTNLIAFLKTYFDGIYQVLLVSGTNIKTINSSSILGSGNLVVSGGGNTFADNVFAIQDDGDATKQIQFQASGITSGQTRTFTVPDSSGTLALKDFAQTFSAAQTFSNQLINSLNGALSTPPVSITGTWVTSSGTATTTKPQFLIEPSGTTSTGWSTAGTAIGVNAASGFTGRFLSLQIAGAEVFRVDSGGGIICSQTVNSGNNLVAAGTVNAGSSSTIFFSGRGKFSSPADGIIALQNSGQTGFTRLDFGLTTNDAAAIGFDAVNGFTLQSAAGTSTWNNPSTANSGTVANRYMFGIAAPTLTSTGTSVTNTVASTFYIGGAPVDSTNTTSTTKWALKIAADNINFVGSLVMNNAALATNATDGFIYIPSCAGTPSGTPTAFTGRIPLIFDSSNNFLYIYNGGAWKKTSVFA